MKKIIFILTIVICSFPLAAQSIQNEFIGNWKAESFLVEQEDGLLVTPEASYSFPYLGITGMQFLDSEFVVFSIDDRKFRAFYEIEMLDFDNYHMRCSFKNGEKLLLKLVRAGNRWKYLYRISESSVLKIVSTADEEITEDKLVEDKTAEDKPVKPETVDDEAVEAPLMSLHTGFLSLIN